jgi:hypothetical protein
VVDDSLIKDDDTGDVDVIAAWVVTVGFFLLFLLLEEFRFDDDDDDDDAAADRRWGNKVESEGRSVRFLLLLLW